jgi:inosine-uridine nucleoside N-ribohydrolase
MNKPNVVLIIDGTTADAYVGLLAAVSKEVSFDLKAVIITGHPVYRADTGPTATLHLAETRMLQEDIARHAKGLLMRHGGEHVPVFQGGKAPVTALTLDRASHRLLDLRRDYAAPHSLAGNLEDALDYLSALEGQLHIICCAPLTDAETLMRRPELSKKLGLITSLLGSFGAGKELLYQQRLAQRHVLADPYAANSILQDYPQPVYLLPIGVSRQQQLAMRDSGELGAALGEGSAAQELTAMYRRSWHMQTTEEGSVFFEAFHAVALMDALLAMHPKHHHSVEGFEARVIGGYELLPVAITDVPRLPADAELWGTIMLRKLVSADYLEFAEHPRYVATRCAVHEYTRALHCVFCGVR